MHGDGVVQNHVLDLRLFPVGELIPLGAKDFDAVKVEGVMAGGDHHPGVHLMGHREAGHRRGGHHPQGDTVRPAGTKPRRQGGFYHIRGKAGILADEHLGLLPLPQALPQDGSQGLPHLGTALDGEIPVGDAPDAVGTK